MAPVSDGAFAAWLAGKVGELLLGLQATMAFDDPDALRHAGDKQAHDLLVTELSRWRPADAVLSEEALEDNPIRLTSERVWIVDPLDGTREFGEPGRSDWAVHVALWSRQTESLAAGAIALPAVSRVLSTDVAPSYPPLHPSAAAGGPIRIVTSRTRPPSFLPALASSIGAELVPMGSAGAKIAAVITGEADAYIHAGGQYEWDSAAPVAVALATGLHASRIDGSPLVYNRPDPSLPDLLVCRADLAARLLSAVSQHG
ncbi:3'(2'),5'-bisphosphate nucleotidase CysQ [Rhizocola hellebori]|uniref:3'(2'),5'-bisphosphate nucleotidase CysQ n=1 Tax=Rhizocola hellebori TaxID=1392758 RepID=A0A8J3VJU6_9ACTN|nr:3'(2'),5'-bisphosphate nucleotidase CysQ [Rhizocola hellebori]GIH09085.1 3'(2'),5'-bisphosphate nucleotidase CysQ [Rhizocola hellebori]